MARKNIRNYTHNDLHYITNKVKSFHNNVFFLVLSSIYTISNDIVFCMIFMLFVQELTLNIAQHDSIHLTHSTSLNKKYNNQKNINNRKYKRKKKYIYLFPRFNATRSRRNIVIF